MFLYIDGSGYIQKLTETKLSENQLVSNEEINANTKVKYVKTLYYTEVTVVEGALKIPAAISDIDIIGADKIFSKEYSEINRLYLPPNFEYLSEESIRFNHLKVIELSSNFKSYNMRPFTNVDRILIRDLNTHREFFDSSDKSLMNFVKQGVKYIDFKRETISITSK